MWSELSISQETSPKPINPLKGLSRFATANHKFTNIHGYRFDKVVPFRDLLQRNPRGALFV